jgi:hypothetical protein
MSIASAVLSALIMAAPSHAAVDLDKESSSKGPRGTTRTLTGAWRTVVTPESCQTGEQFTPLSGLFTFNEGGTMAEFGIGPGQSPALRSPGHGVWAKTHGGQEFSFAFTFYRYSAAGILVGSQRVSGTLQLDWTGAEFATQSSIEVLDLTDTVVGRGCATAVGTRFE